MLNGIKDITNKIMCGICGFTSSISDKENYLNRMLNQLTSRGPDAEGIYSDHNVNFGHKRLSIIDLNSRSNQPFLDKQTGNILVFNGEIYNFKKIKLDLIEQKKCVFLTTSDTEVVLKSYAYYGLDCFSKFDGMFAIAIWDAKKAKLILARDRFGEKPLYYNFFFNEGKRQISFASNLNSLKYSPNFNNTINKKSLKSYLINNYVNNFETFYEGSYNLEPGSILIFQNNQIINKKYFEISNYFKKKNKYKKFNLEEFEEILIKSVESRLVSDVDVGIFLSGGLDSSIIASVAKNLGAKMKSYTLGFNEVSYDESNKAKFVSDNLEIENEKFIIDEKDLNDIDKIVSSFGEPVADTSIIPTYFLSKFVSKKTKVCLGGDGGDELFFGYDTYTASRTHDILKNFKIGYLLRNLKFVKNYLPKKKTKVNYFYAIQRFIDSFDDDRENFFVHEFWREINNESSLRKILSKDLYSEISDLKIHQYNIEKFETDINSHRNMCDFEFFLERDILVKSDRCTMANSLELRSPFLSYDLFNYMSELDPKDKFDAFNKKKILKKIAKKYLPEKIINQKKRGFNAPVSNWLNSKFKNTLQDLLYSENCKSLFNLSRIETILKENDSTNKDYGNELFNIFCLAIWINNNKLKI